MFMLEVTLPGWDCVCMHAFLYLYELKCVNVHQITSVFLFFSSSFFFFFVEMQLIGLCMQVCEHSEKEVFALGLHLTFWLRGRDPGSLAHANANSRLVAT